MQNTSLTEEFIQTAKQRLLKEIDELEKQEKQLKEEDPYKKQDRDIGNSEFTDEAILEDRTKELIDIKLRDMGEMKMQINKALAKIEEGTYGICEETGQSIDKARLEAYPEATTIIK